MFDIYIGIDYSGAHGPEQALPGLAVVKAAKEAEPEVIRNPADPRGLWSRAALHAYLERELENREQQILVGIDHGFSYPIRELEHYGLHTWDDFLCWFETVWETERHSVQACIRKGARYRNANDLRVAEERFAIGASSVLDLDRKHGHPSKTVSFSSHAGIPWLHALRRRFSLEHVQFWPFDHIRLDGAGTWEVRKPGGHVICEVYPRICKDRLRYKVHPPANSDGTPLTEHELDAWSIAAWAKERDGSERLLPYLLLPTLLPAELAKASAEGWILGCL